MRSNSAECYHDARHNPFATRAIGPGFIPYQFAPGESIASLAQAWEISRRQGELVGRHGIGKSTLLSEFVRYWRMNHLDVHVVSLNADAGADVRSSVASWLAWETLASGAIVCVDGYETLRWSARRNLRQRIHVTGAGLLVTTHKPARFPWSYRVQCSLPQLQAVVSWLQRSVTGYVSTDDVEATFALCRGNARETLFALYDIYQQKQRSQTP
jgi:hypothetical protein